MTAGRQGRVCTDEELRELSASPRDRVLTAERSTADALRGHLAILEREHRGQRERYLDWVVIIL